MLERGVAVDDLHDRLVTDRDLRADVSLDEVKRIRRHGGIVRCRDDAVGDAPGALLGREGGDPPKSEQDVAVDLHRRRGDFDVRRR
jgi:hypothetical protein